MYAQSMILEDKRHQLPHHWSHGEDVMIDIIRLHTAREYPILEILYHTPQADVVVAVHTYDYHLDIDMFITGNDIDTPALTMTYRTRLVARTRSTAKQLFPVFPRLRRYVVAINNAIDDKLLLRTRVTKSQLKDRKSPITDNQFFSFFYRTDAHSRNKTIVRLIKLMKDAHSNNRKRFFKVLKKYCIPFPS